MTEPLYRCSACREHKPASAFHAERSRPRPVQYRCKLCQKLYVAHRSPAVQTPHRPGEGQEQ